MYSHVIYYFTLFVISFHQNALLLFSKSVISSVLTPLLAPCGIFDSFLLSESTYFGGAHFTSFSFRKCSNHARTCRTLHTSETVLKLCRIWLWNCHSHAKISSIVVQDLSIPRLTPHVLFHPHSLMGDTPFMWNASSVKNDAAHLVGEISIFDKYHTTCLASTTFTKAAILLIDKYPQKVIVVNVKSAIRYNTQFINVLLLSYVPEIHFL